MKTDWEEVKTLFKLEAIDKLSYEVAVQVRNQVRLPIIEQVLYQTNRPIYHQAWR